jgi:hypothetical protein
MRPICRIGPGVETPGYAQASLRDDRVWSNSSLQESSLKPVGNEKIGIPLLRWFL